ncbi:MAG: MFS transporter [Spirochaetales bacterium]|nr:MFS transporter [Spirochaetales bacterium]
MKKRSLLLLFSVVFMDMVGFGFIIPLLPDYIARFGGAPALVGLLASAYALGQFFAAPIVGRLSDKYGRKPLLLISIGGTFLSLLLLGTAWVLPVVFLSRILDGLTGGNITVAQSYIADVTTDEERAKGLGLIGAAFGLGFILGPLFGGLLSRFSLSAPAFAAAGVAFLNLLLIAFVLPESLTAERRAEMAANPRRKFSVRLLWEALKKRQTGSVLHVIALYSLAFIMFQTMFSLVAKERLGIGADTRGYILAYVGVLAAGVQGGLIGVLTKRFSETKLMLASGVLLAIGFVLWAVASTVWFLLIALVPIALGGGVLGVVNRSLLSKSVKPEEIGGALGLSASLESLNGIIAPALGGLLLSQIGDWAPGAAAALILVWATFFIWRKIVRPGLFFRSAEVQPADV